MDNREKGGKREREREMKEAVGLSYWVNAREKRGCGFVVVGFWLVWCVVRFEFFEFETIRIFEKDFYFQTFKKSGYRCVTSSK